MESCSGDKISCSAVPTALEGELIRKVNSGSGRVGWLPGLSASSEKS